MNRTSFLLLICCMPLLFLTGSCKGQSLKPIANGTSTYSIVIPDDASKSDKIAGTLLKTFIRRATGTDLPLVTEKTYKGTTAFYVGKTARTTALPEFNTIRDDGFLMATRDKNIFISGRRGHSSEYAVYSFLETYLGCRKYDGAPAVVPRLKEVVVPYGLSIVSNPVFVYRQSYYPMSNDAEYLNWHGLHRFEDLWGLWGHTFFKLVPPQEFFAGHPEYFSLVNGKRVATQLCLSNSKVLELVISRLRQRMADNPDADYWSVSPNDGGGNCTCPDCKKADNTDGSPSGSLIRFVNQVAAAFPDKKITTLGYGYSSHAPKQTKVAGNVVVLLSTIDMYREKALAELPSAAGFRNDLEGWRKVGTSLFVWDYTTQFTNYLSPFPILDILRPNITYFKEHGITGVFEHGSGDTYADMAELNSYVQAKLLWNDKADVKTIVADFCNGFYGNGAAFVQEYLNLRQQALTASGKHLDIYGNPFDDRRSFLSPGQLKQYEDLLDKAAGAVTDTRQSANIDRIKLSLRYVRLQQSRHFGTEDYGFLQAGNIACSIRPDFRNQVTQFVASAKKANVIELSEYGLSPEQYQEEWNNVLNRKWPVSLAYNAKVTLQFPFSEDYPAKGNHTLTDGMTGFPDFSYNWLCFYGVDMVATLETEKLMSFSTISLNFLDDPRHWIFLPVSVSVSYSEDGVTYKEAGQTVTGVQSEHENQSIRNFSFNVSGRAKFVKVVAQNNTALPDWRNYGSKKPMIACDEIMVLP